MTECTDSSGDSNNKGAGDNNDGEGGMWSKLYYSSCTVLHVNKLYVDYYLVRLRWNRRVTSHLCPINTLSFP